MFENLFQLVKEHAGEAIINNPAIPNENNDDAISTAANSIMDSLKGQMSSGGIASITSLFTSGNASSNPIIGQISTAVSAQLMQKFGIDSSAASGIVQNLVPTVMGQLVNKTNDAADNTFNMDSILASLGGGNAGGLLDSVKGMFGK